MTGRCCEVTSDDTPDGHDDGHSVLLVRRHRYTGKLSFYRCWTPGPVPLSRLIAIAVARWRIEMVFTQLAKRAVRPVGGGREHVADLDLAVGDDHAVDEQFGQQPRCSKVAVASPARMAWQNASMPSATACSSSR